MKASKITNRVHIGETVLAAARLTDTSRIAEPLKAFIDVHKALARAQARVDDAVARAQVVVKRANELDVHQDTALDRLLLLLPLDGKPRGNPLEPYTGVSPSVLRKTAAGDEAAQLLDLAAAVRNDVSASAATREAADAMEVAARAVLEALVPLPQLEAALRAARHIRDHTGDRWDEALRVLKLAARAAEAQGAIGLYGTLFDRSVRRSKRTKTGTTPAPDAWSVAA